MLPNDVFKRPGPHHAYEVDPDALARLRTAIAPLEELGDSGPLAALLGREIDTYAVHDAYHYCLVDEDFGLDLYGPMFDRMGLSTMFGELLIPRRDPQITPISHVWLELSPWLPQRVAPASEIYVDLALLDPPAMAWLQLLLGEMAYDLDRHDLFQGHDESDAAFDVRLDAWIEDSNAANHALVERWKVDCRPEVEMFRSKLREIGDRGGLVATWHSEQGWL